LMLSIPSLSAATSVNLVWSGVNTTGGSATLNGNSVTIDPSATATLTLDVQLVVDARGVNAAFLDFDWGLDLDNELNLLAWEELSWSNAMGGRTLTPVRSIPEHRHGRAYYR